MRLTRNPLPSRFRSPILTNIIIDSFRFLSFTYQEYDRPIHRTY